MNSDYATFQTPTPSAMGYRIVKDHIDGYALMDLALSGTHYSNPYHNVVHELQAVYYSNAAFRHTADYNKSDARLLTIAALFHDHNHSGGKYKDDVNIQMAVGSVNCLLPNSGHGYLRDSELDTICDIIRCTMFIDGAFPNEPETILEQCMRDADLCAIYTDEGRELLRNLTYELHVSNPEFTALYQMETRKEIDSYLKRNADFLRLAPMYTDYGTHLKDCQLESSLSAYEELLSSLPFAK